MYLRGIDAYITDSKYHKEEMIFICRKCENEIEMLVEVEYGRYVVPDNAWCCDREMEVMI